VGLTIPVEAWRADGWIPRLPESLEVLDSLLVMVAKPRTVRRDGIHFEGLRFFAPTLAAYVGESVTIRYDPRDIGEIRVFYRNSFLCRAINPEQAGQNITLKDVQAARSAYRRQLRSAIKEKRERVPDLLGASLGIPLAIPVFEDSLAPKPLIPESTPKPSLDSKPDPQPEHKHRHLRTYKEDE